MPGPTRPGAPRWLRRISHEPQPWLNPPPKVRRFLHLQLSGVRPEATDFRVDRVNAGTPNHGAHWSGLSPAPNHVQRLLSEPKVRSSAENQLKGRRSTVGAARDLKMPEPPAHSSVGYGAQNKAPRE